MTYISEKQLSNLKHYKYAGVDHSLTSKYVLKPFYSNVAIKFFPYGMAPNLITLTGFGFVIVNFLTLMFYNPTLDRDCPPWVYASWAAGLFLYQTFDAIDGAQARRTKQSGPLGELFDHGVDACNTTLEVLLFAGATNLGQTWSTMLVLFGCALTFYIQTWEEYYTHQLTLGYVSGPVEGVLTLVIVFAITAFQGGASYWQQPAMPALGIPDLDLIPDSLYQQTWSEGFILFGGVVLTYNTVTSILNVIKVRQERKEDAMTPLFGLAPLALTWLLHPLYLYLFPTVLTRHLVPYMLFVGILNAYSVGQIIVGHLTIQDFPMHNCLNIPLAAACLDEILMRTGFSQGFLRTTGYEVGWTLFMLGMALGVYGVFVQDVIVAFCEHLDIWCLTIKHPKVDSQGNELKKQQ